MGGTALHYAASGGHLEAAQLLIDCGVHINALVETTDEVCTTVLVVWLGIKSKGPTGQYFLLLPCLRLELTANRAIT